MDLWRRSYGGLLKPSPDKNKALLANNKEMVSLREGEDTDDDEYDNDHESSEYLLHFLEDHIDDSDDHDVDGLKVEAQSQGGQMKRRKLVTVCGSAPAGSGTKTRRGLTGAAGGVQAEPASCQVDRCAVDLAVSKQYHHKHKVCEAHSKMPEVVVSGGCQRFCQQCSRFHELSKFDGAKRSCHEKLEKHNMRRRRSQSQKSSQETSADGEG